MDLQDSSIQGYKIYRDKTASVDNDRKSTQQGVEVTAQSDTTGKYTVANGGDEQGWIYTHPKDTDTRHNVGSYAQVYPAILRDSDSKIIPILDKSLAEDSNYAAKTQSVTPGDSSTTASVAETAATGTPGIVVGCLNHEAQEQIFFPLVEAKIKVDHQTEGNLSTKIYDVKSDGTLNLANIGTTKDFLFVEDNQANLRVESNFRMDATKKGPLDFENAALPSLDTPTESGNFEVKCVWNTDKWSWYAIAEKKETILYARVRWNFTSEDGDISEGELLSYDSATDSYSATGVAIWIDTEKSSQCQFHTGGDSTIFIVKLLKIDVERGAITRNLYYCSQCVKDDGYAITHFEKIAKAGDGYLDVNFLSDEIAYPPWEVTNRKIYTTIVSTPSENILMVKVPEDWDAGTSSLANWDYTELSDISKGVFFLAKPIRPRLTDIDTLQWESSEYYDGSTIATYQTKE